MKKIKEYIQKTSVCMFSVDSNRRKTWVVILQQLFSIMELCTVKLDFVFHILFQYNILHLGFIKELILWWFCVHRARLPPHHHHSCTSPLGPRDDPRGERGYQRLWFSSTVVRGCHLVGNYKNRVRIFQWDLSSTCGFFLFLQNHNQR